MDADALIKLTKASLKEVTLTSFDAVIPQAVEHEAVHEGKAGEHGDAVIIERNLEAGRLRLGEAAGDHRTMPALEEFGLEGGESEVLDLHARLAADLIVSDDARFLRLVEGLGLPFATPTALVVAMVRMGSLGRREALAKLDELAPHISESEVLGAREALMEDAG